CDWKLGDKAWEDKRLAQWPVIEEIITTVRDKNKKAVNAIKRYFLKGDLPDWEKLNAGCDSDDVRDRHLDLATFLWLHPSTDYDLLKGLRDTYMQGYGRQPQDVLAGMGFLLDWGVRISSDSGVACAVPSPNGKGYVNWKPGFVFFDGKGKLLFDLVYGSIDGLTFNFGEEQQSFDVIGPNLGSLQFADQWLCHKKLNEHGKSVLLQYDLPLEFMFRRINAEPQKLSREFARRRFVFEKALFRFHHFDIEKEGDTPRATFVAKIRKILDEGEHVAELKQLWEQIKRGESTVENPWKL